jgi:integrase
LAETYLERHAKPFKKARSVKNDCWLLDKYIKPRLGHRKVSDVTHADIDQIHASLHETPILANRILALLSMAFGLAERWGLREPGSSPTRGVKRYKERRRERFLSAAELGRLGEALREVEQEDPKRVAPIAAFRVAIFTGARRGELENLKWSEVDLGGAALNLASGKAGPRRVVLNAPAVEVLSGLERRSEWVFPKPEGSGPINLTATWYRVRRRAGLEDVRLHDLRHSHASVGVSAGLGLPILAKILGHSSTAMTERYSHLADDPIREASELIAGRIAASLDGHKEAEVVPLVQRDG